MDYFYGAESPDVENDILLPTSYVLIIFRVSNLLDIILVINMNNAVHEGYENMYI